MLAPSIALAEYQTKATLVHYTQMLPRLPFNLKWKFTEKLG